MEKDHRCCLVDTYVVGDVNLHSISEAFSFALLGNFVVSSFLYCEASRKLNLFLVFNFRRGVFRYCACQAPTWLLKAAGLATELEV